LHRFDAAAPLCCRAPEALCYAARKKVIFLKNSSALRFAGEKIGSNLPHGPKTWKIELKNEAKNCILSGFLTLILAY
jgi:hypothetical protein